ncbi:MAG: hypothetical protein LBM18_02550 [Oscillospiraceae bacterium]|jgi:hypothetical protein|nr:hypothetical protein [Oscillospiraceae bacterium]
MKVHIFSRTLEVIEYGRGEHPTPEEIAGKVRESLSSMGESDWPSVELEAFECSGGTLVFATPVKVFVPKWLVQTDNR